MRLPQQKTDMSIIDKIREAKREYESNKDTLQKLKEIESNYFILESQFLAHIEKEFEEVIRKEIREKNFILIRPKIMYEECALWVEVGHEKPFLKFVSSAGDTLLIPSSTLGSSKAGRPTNDYAFIRSFFVGDIIEVDKLQKNWEEFCEKFREPIKLLCEDKR